MKRRTLLKDVPLIAAVLRCPRLATAEVVAEVPYFFKWDVDSDAKEKLLSYQKMPNCPLGRALLRQMVLVTDTEKGPRILSEQPSASGNTKVQLAVRFELAFTLRGEGTGEESSAYTSLGGKDMCYRLKLRAPEEASFWTQSVLNVEEDNGDKAVVNHPSLSEELGLPNTTVFTVKEVADSDHYRYAVLAYTGVWFSLRTENKRLIDINILEGGSGDKHPTPAYLDTSSIPSADR